MLLSKGYVRGICNGAIDPTAFLDDTYFTKEFRLILTRKTVSLVRGWRCVEAPPNMFDLLLPRVSLTSKNIRIRE